MLRKGKTRIMQSAQLKHEICKKKWNKGNKQKNKSKYNTC